ncbi:unnamed protein product [Meganyctiphanes norvegica]|uniref:DOMON domain-containing protein n=1 Tax=Meganyctiphanes norvegica TaxID=48144 RepID=A0AAV2PWB6_MEGNR
MSCQNQNRSFNYSQGSVRLNLNKYVFYTKSRNKNTKNFDLTTSSASTISLHQRKKSFSWPSSSTAKLHTNEYGRACTSPSNISSNYIALLLVIILSLAPLSYSNPGGSSSSSPRYESWKYEMNLDVEGSFLVQWTPMEDHIVFRVIARTRGYIGLGLSSRPYMDGADIVVGWVHSGKAYLQDRHAVGNGEPIVDRQQNWMLVAGFENDTHTVLIMSRRYNTCDNQDHVISNDTVRLLWAFHPDDPVNPEHARPRLHYHGWRRGVQSLYLIARPTKQLSPTLASESLHGKTEYPYTVSDESSRSYSWIVKNNPVEISDSSDTLMLCSIFKPPTLFFKHHIIKYEPMIVSNNSERIWRIMLYECSTREKSSRMEKLIEIGAEDCNQKSRAGLGKSCRAVVVAWTRGSSGVTFPENVGYPLYAEPQRYYMLEIHYDIPKDLTFWDSSGLRIIYTHLLRDHDAGVLSLGLSPVWKNLIPPQQYSVTKEGHCVKECTRAALPKTGINVFGVVHHTHFLGRKVRIRHIHNGSEQEPLIEDNNYDPSFQEYRTIHHSRTVMPGDHLITECNFNSMERSIITLGGLTSRDVTCTSFLFYWPKVNMSLCQSKPSLSTVLYSLGIQELSPDSGPIKISRPMDLAGKTLKWRLLNYDWLGHFHYFQRATREGTFNPSCDLAPKLENVDYKYPKIQNLWLPKNVCKAQENEHHVILRDKEDTSYIDYDSLAFQDSAAFKPLAIIDVDPYRNLHVPHAFESTKWGQAKKVFPDPGLEEELQEVERDLESEVHQKYPDGYQERATKKGVTSDSWSFMSCERFSHWLSMEIMILGIIVLRFY